MLAVLVQNRTAKYFANNFLKGFEGVWGNFFQKFPRVVPPPPSTPILPIQAAELDGFGDVVGGDDVGLVKVGNGSGNAENAVVPARG
jgi:hypothetical protein